MKEQKSKKQQDCNMIDFPVSLSKYLALCGVASRRKSVDLIKGGGVDVNGNCITEPGFKLMQDDFVAVKEKPITPESKVYVMLNKPRGVVCTSSDPHASKKAIDLIDIRNTRLFTVGRLDKDSEGLILLTNDGDFANQVMHPRHGVVKRYLVSTDRPLTAQNLKTLCDGVTDDGEFLKALKVTEKENCCYEFLMSEGKKREIRRLVKTTGKKVIRLQRIAIGGLNINNLKSGNWRHLSKDEIALCFISS